MTRTGRLAASREPRNVLAIKPFRRLWVSLSLSSLGDWLSILALTSMASTLTADQGFTVQNYAVGGVLIIKLLPAVVLGPLAGALADRFDRRLNMVIGDVLRCLLYVSIPLIPSLSWLMVANFLAECIALFWAPAKEASVPNIVPKKKLEQANQFSLAGTYGTAPLAAGLFVLLALAASALGTIDQLSFLKTSQNDLALYVNGLTFLIAALVVWNLKEISKRDGEGKISVPSMPKQVIEGWRFVGTTPIVRGLVIGMLGAFAAGGAVIGLSQVYVRSLGGGNAGYGVVFGSVFLGLAFGMFLGPRLLKDFSRLRLFGLAIVAAGVMLALIGLIAQLVVVTFLTAGLGACAGVAWVTGFTLLGREVDDAIRGRTFAFVASLTRVVLLLVLAVVPFLSGLIGPHSFRLTEHVTYRVDGTNAVLLIAAVVSVCVGVVAYRQMDDGSKGVSLWRELYAAIRGIPVGTETPQLETGVLIAFEGGEGAGKSTQARLLAIWLRDQGYDVVTTQEPGATKIGMRLRAILLDKNTEVSARAETLMYAADRAEHVDAVIRPALARGAVVITDRYVDSTLAYQGAGRDLPMDDLAQLNTFATGGLVPDLTVLLDLPPETGLGRHGSPADRLESEPRAFHDRVRRGFRGLAELAPERYLVVDASRPLDDITRELRDQVRSLLPDPVPSTSEDITHTFPAIKD